jgi:predicted nucleic acid-binding protein
MFLLDTNVVSELRKAGAGRADPGVVQWATSVPTASMFIAAVTLYELEYGIRLVERRDTRQGSVLRAWMTNDVIPAFHGRVLAVDQHVAISAAGFDVPDRGQFRDTLIGATAVAHRLTLVTRNVADFRHVDGCRTLNPWPA